MSDDIGVLGVIWSMSGGDIEAHGMIGNRNYNVDVHEVKVNESRNDSVFVVVHGVRVKGNWRVWTYIFVFRFQYPLIFCHCLVQPPSHKAI